MLGSVGSGRIPFDESAATLPGVSAPSSVVRSMVRIASSSAQIFASRLIERSESDAARSSSSTACGVYLVPAAWRQLRSPAPTLLLDDEGIEGEFGFVPWIHFKHAEICRRYRGRPSIVRVVRFELVSASNRERRARHQYASGML